MDVQPTGLRLLRCLSRHEEGFQVSAESIVQRTKTVLEVEGDPSRVLPRCGG